MLVPGWLDRWLARKAWQGQMTREPEIARADDLFEPVVGLHRTGGRFGQRERKHVHSFDASHLRTGAGLASAVAFIVLAALLIQALA